MIWINISFKSSSFEEDFRFLVFDVSLFEGDFRRIDCGAAKTMNDYYCYFSLAFLYLATREYSLVSVFTTICELGLAMNLVTRITK